jgi:methylglutaconyl-CoA hydratase
MEQSEPKVLLRMESPVAVLLLNDPAARNALSAEMVAAVHEGLDRVEQEPQIRAVVITGAGTAFCGGAHLGSLLEMASQGVEENRKDSLRLARFFRRIYLFPKPVIAAVNGPAIAGGCGLASVCDLTVAASSARFAYSEVRIGFVPAIVAVFLLRQVGEKRARDLLLTARSVDAAEALRIGLVNDVVPPDRLLEHCRARAVQAGGNSPDALRLTKELIPLLQGASLDQALDQAVSLNTLARTTEDFREGIASFLEKREPRWKLR